MIKEDYKLCRWPTEEGGCENDAKYMITWEPMRINAEDQEIFEEETIQEVNDAIAGGELFADRIPVCEKHRTEAEEDFRSMRFPSDANIDLITIAQIVSYSVVRREQIMTIEVAGPDEYTEQHVEVVAVSQEEIDPAAPYGYDDDGNPNAPYGWRKNGMPARKRGGPRKTAAS